MNRFIRRSLGLLAFGAMWNCGSIGEATTALGFDVTGGIGTSGFAANGSLDIKVDPHEKPWETSLGYTYLHSTVGTESRTNQYNLGVAHPVDNNGDAHVTGTYWKDTLNDVKYIGPSLGFTYTWNEGDSSTTKPKSKEESGPKTSKDFATQYYLVEDEKVKSEKVKNDSSEKEQESDDPKPREIMAISLDMDFFFYSTEVVASSTTRRVFDPRLRKFVYKTIPGGTGSEKVSQFHPSLTIEKPLFGDAITPFITAGHYFYDKDPGAIENLAGRPLFTASAGHLNSLVGGFLNNNGVLGVRFSLPWDIDTSAQLGAEQSAIDLTWSTSQEVTLTRLFADHLKVKLDWSRAIQAGVSSDLFTGGLSYQF